MAIDRQGTGLAVTRIAIGTFLLFMGINKYQWFFDSSILAAQFNDWAEASTAGSVSRWYLSQIAVPGLAVFARLVPLGEMVCGAALVCGLRTPLFAFIAFFMTLNFQIASGLIFTYAFLTNGYCLPVLGSTLGLAIGGVRLPWSVSRGS
jgi:uncharacterized membrane protein YphA (DoxX/SURF4 family)